MGIVLNHPLNSCLYNWKISATLSPHQVSFLLHWVVIEAETLQFAQHTQKKKLWNAQLNMGHL